jgi:hypothetical protein
MGGSEERDTLFGGWRSGKDEIEGVEDGGELFFSLHNKKRMKKE